MKRMKNRRSGKDRRKSNQPVSFPLRDSNGEFIAKERRCITDRRADGLELTVTNIPKKEFDDYFKKFQENPEIEMT